MSANRATDLLNRLLVLHTRSLPLYLLDAAPWTQPSDEESLAVIHDIAHDQQETAEQLIGLIMQRNATPHKGDFPLTFTIFNDLSVEFLVKEMIRRQRLEIAAIEDCVGRLSADPAAAAVAEEALGAAKAHLDSLRELEAQADRATVIPHAH
ncbi:MAG: hypothetical protein ACKOUR_20095 [Planctomycetota bacterium]